ncbi:TPA: hypothetical protein KOR49_002385 [Clostridioides difficile]|uniref:Uncharacterized protein n=1 Tax=Clostridioides difficile TaxID=1496 RepID=A0AAN5VM55_CLODI|nr:hypothetical protein [Clostridioides difficile]EGT3943973.1 hypothetical protein [Clostridioides difficile]MBG0198734.1 hypothetical protein [Clostridioides difficile]MCA0574578.1 hypothetical protein [Clostridioides difficile]MDW0076884.1 hypothetical protein [Clostridioides difficile]PBG30484.1 hypothetical protein BGU81_02430 [Clostridioides difficile]
MDRILTIVVRFLMKRLSSYNKNEEDKKVLLEINDSIYLTSVDDIKNHNTEEYFPVKTSSLSVAESILSEIILEEAINVELPIVHRCTICSDVIYGDNVSKGIYGDICEKCNESFNKI